MVYIVFGLIGILLFIFWCVQLCSLMQMGDEEFKGKNDKLIWALVILIANLVGAFLFWRWKQPEIESQTGIENQPDNVDRYKEVLEKIPEYNEIIDATLSLAKLERVDIEKWFTRQSSEKLIKKFRKGPDDMKEGAYGILIAELLCREVDIASL